MIGTLSGPEVQALRRFLNQFPRRLSVPTTWPAAVRRLWEGSRGGPWDHLRDYKDEIETVAQYLGVEENEVQPVTVTQHDARKLVELGNLVLRFARVERITFHPDGRRPETDADHTVMLGLIAPAFASRFLPKLNLGRIAQLALVHDLVEVYAGDTPTLKITVQGKLMKKEKERVAAQRIADEFTEFPWLTNMVHEYENLLTREARYVKALDKLLPKVTHILNSGATFDTVQGSATLSEVIQRVRLPGRRAAEPCSTRRCSSCGSTCSASCTRRSTGPRRCQREDDRDRPYHQDRAVRPRRAPGHRADRGPGRNCVRAEGQDPGQDHEPDRRPEPGREHRRGDLRMKWSGKAVDLPRATSPAGTTSLSPASTTTRTIPGAGSTQTWDSKVALCRAGRSGASPTWSGRRSASGAGARACWTSCGSTSDRGGGTMKDWRGTEIAVGSGRGYPGRKGSSMWMVEGTVVKVILGGPPTRSGVGRTRTWSRSCAFTTTALPLDPGGQPAGPVQTVPVLAASVTVVPARDMVQTEATYIEVDGRAT